MPSIFTEETTTGTLVFEFSDKWQVCKYDELPFYTKIKQDYKGFKAVDFLATSKKSLLLMEIKYISASDKKSFIRFSEDADNERIANIQKKLTEECQLSKTERSFIKITSSRPYLVDEVAKKVKDTLLCLFAAYRQNNEDLEKHSRSLFCNPDKPILVLLFLERNTELNKAENFQPLASHLKLKIEQKLSFLDNIHVSVVNSLTLPSELSINILENEAKI